MSPLFPQDEEAKTQNKTHPQTSVLSFVQHLMINIQNTQYYTL